MKIVGYLNKQPKAWKPLLNKKGNWFYTGLASNLSFKGGIGYTDFNEHRSPVLSINLRFSYEMPGVSSSSYMMQDDDVESDSGSDIGNYRMSSVEFMKMFHEMLNNPKSIVESGVVNVLCYIHKQGDIMFIRLVDDDVEWAAV